MNKTNINKIIKIIFEERKKDRKEKEDKKEKNDIDGNRNYQ